MKEFNVLKDTGAVLVDDYASITLMYNCYVEGINVFTERICKDINIFVIV